MMQPITDYNAFFEGAKAALAESAELANQSREVSRDKGRYEAELENYQKSVANEILATKEKRRNEINKVYDGELSKLQDRGRKIRSQREKAKNQGIKARITEETAPMRTNIKGYREQLKTLFRNNGVPGICQTRLYYSVFYPSCFTDWLIIILGFIVFFVVIPVGIWSLFLKDAGAVPLIIIYVADILVFGGLLMLINRSTVRKYDIVLQQGLEIQKSIRREERVISNVTNAIYADKDEGKYNLSSFDDDLAKLEASMADVTMRKKDALNTFDTVTSNIITDEINNNAKPKLDELAAKVAEMSSLLETVKTKSNQKTMELSDNYEVYLGKEFMDPNKLDILKLIMQNGTATNISEAITEYRRKED